MDKSLMLLSFLQKNCNIEEQIPNTPQERFDFYRRWVNKLPNKYANESFLRIEDGFLIDALKEKTIFSAKNQEEMVVLKSGEAVCFEADAVLAFLNDGNDKSVYLYGGTRMKNAVANALKGKDTAVTKANNINYKGVISCILPKIDLKLTSVILNNITEKYKFALNVAKENSLQSLVLCLPNIENPLLCSKLADAIISTIKQHEYAKNIKLVLLAPSDTVLGVYKSKLNG